MNYSLLPPCNELKGIISHFWVGTWDESSRKPNNNYYIIANSLTEITFAFQNNNPQAELLFSTVQGQTFLPHQTPVDGFYHLMGVSIYSYAIPSLFNIPASELNGEFIPLNTFLGNEGRILTEKIALATSTYDRIKRIEYYFKGLLNKRRMEDRLISKAIHQMRQSNGNSKIIDLSKDFSLSQKQFNRRFREFSGFNPKMYARILRFESLIRNYKYRSKLTEAAYASGYYDQAHLNHEFKAFTGLSPKEFWKLSE